MIIHTEINDAIMFSFNGNARSSEKYIIKKEIILTSYIISTIFI